MDTEKVLTDEEIIAIGQQARAIEGGENGYILPITFARSIEQAVLQSTTAMLWISVDEEMPSDNNKSVLALHSDGEIEIVWGQLIHETSMENTYTHWMPLPDFPEA